MSTILLVALVVFIVSFIIGYVVSIKVMIWIYGEPFREVIRTYKKRDQELNNPSKYFEQGDYSK